MKYPNEFRQQKKADIIAAYNSGMTNYTELSRRFSTYEYPLSRSAVGGIIDRARAKNLIMIPLFGNPIVRRASVQHARSAVRRNQKTASPKPKKSTGGGAAMPPKPPAVVALVPVAALPEVTEHPFEQRERRMLAFYRMVESRGCKFPVGDPHDADFHFCCAERLEGEPYCPAHQALTHIPLGKWRESNRHAFAEAAE
jgi:hypothetical protein